MIGRVSAPVLTCDYRSLDGHEHCEARFGGDQPGETPSRLRRRAKTEGWRQASCAWWRGIHGNRLFDICPDCSAAEADIIESAAAK